MPAATTKGKKKAAVASPEPAAAPPPQAPVEPAPKAPKKAKKPVKVVAVVTPDGIAGSFTPEPRRPLIAHLNVRSSDSLFPDAGVSNSGADGEPEPYNPAGANVFADEQESIQNAATVNFSVSQAQKEPTESKLFSSAAPESRPMQCFAKADLMVQFAEDSKAKQLPDRTDIACFWCAHTFDWTPCVIPEREVAGVYNVYGNFCCPECAFSYLLHETMDPHVRWERIALLHRIYDRDGKGRMTPAPGRESLKLFGGPLTIESFRATIRTGKVRIDTHMPPMVSILGSIDTKPIDFFDSSLKNTLIGSLQMEKTQKAEEGLRLKRSKPLKDKESTLDSVMNISIRSGGR